MCMKIEQKSVAIQLLSLCAVNLRAIRCGKSSLCKLTDAELFKTSNKHSTEAMRLLGMVYGRSE